MLDTNNRTSLHYKTVSSLLVPFFTEGILSLKAGGEGGGCLGLGRGGGWGAGRVGRPVGVFGELVVVGVVGVVGSFFLTLLVLLVGGVGLKE